MNTERDVSGTDALHAGWDCFFTKPGAHALLHCRVCGEPMAVERGAIGPTSWVHAMAIRAGQAEGRRHDSFHCTHTGEPWHVQALALRQEAEQTPSRRLADLLTAEADEIVRTRTTTKPVSGLV